MRIVAVALVLTASCSLALGATNGAMLMGSGAVQVNGAQASNSYTVFPGDRIETAANGSAVVKSSDAVLSIAGDSSIQYQSNGLNFERGSVLVTAPKGIDAHFGKLVISSDRGHAAKFQLTSVNGVERIAAIDGSLNITDGIHTARLDAGYMMTRAPEAATDDSPTGKSGIPGWVLAVIVLGVVGAIFGGLWAEGAFSGAKSPSAP
jgi:hypothetical protein